MIPNDTNYDTLQVYFDFLEENNHNTDELRESLTIDDKQYYFEYIGTEFSSRVGIGDILYINSVGVFDTCGGVNFSDGISVVGGGFGENDNREVGAKRFLMLGNISDGVANSFL